MINNIKIKKGILLLAAFLLLINSFFTYAGDNDGSSFITKAEFDSLKNNFQSQLDEYNNGIDSKISDAIAAYLAGAQISNIYTKNILYSGNNAEKITCVGDWTPLTCVSTTPGLNLSLVAQSFYAGSSSYKNTSGSLFKHASKKATINDGFIIRCGLSNQQTDGTYDDVYWDGWCENCETLITKVGAMKPEILPFWSYAYYGSTRLENWCPMLTDGFYEDFNTTPTFFSIKEKCLYTGSRGYSPDSGWDTLTNMDFVNHAIKNTRPLSANYRNVISWDKDKDITIGVDDVRYVYASPTGVTGGITKEDWTRSFSTTTSYYRYGVSGNSGGGSQLNFSGSNIFDHYGTGNMPIYGCLGPKSVNDVCVTNYTINGEKIILDKIKLIDGIPLFEGKKGDRVEWEVEMDDTDDYIFYFSHEKFDGIPDTSKCIKCTTNKEKTETVTPEIVGGKTTVKLTFTENGVVWAKWKHKNSLGNAVLNLQNCKTYKLTGA